MAKLAKRGVAKKKSIKTVTVELQKTHKGIYVVDVSKKKPEIKLF